MKRATVMNMPHEEMDEKQVAAYLRMDAREITKLAERGHIPCHKGGAKLRFRKSDIDHWVELRLHTLASDRLGDIEKGVSLHHGFEEGELLVWRMVPAGGLAVPLEGRTGDGAIRALVRLADKAGKVCAADELLGEIRAREELCSTAIFPGVAIPHPRHPLPYDITESFVVVGVTPSGIPFGALDGSLTRVFFLICCKDDRTHLHVLARLARVLQLKNAIDALVEAESAVELGEILLKLEQTAIG
jgi:PTS system nitrogen regulatory IIA component